MSNRRHPHVVNVSEVENHPIAKGTKFGCADRRLAAQTPGGRIGCSHYEVPPGKTAFPFHYHCVNDEAIYVLAGEGTMRIGDARVAVGAGDWISFPPGPAHAHQLINTGSQMLIYLCLSTIASAEVVGYPDSQKTAAMSGPSYERAMKGEHWVRVMVRDGKVTTDYYEGEDIG